MYRKENMDKYRYELTIYKGENLINTIQLFDDGEKIKDFTDFVKYNYREKLLENFTEFDVRLESNLLNSLFQIVDALSLRWCCYYKDDELFSYLISVYQAQLSHSFADTTSPHIEEVNKIFQSAFLKKSLKEAEGVLSIPGEGYFIAFGYNARFSCKKVG